MKWKETCASYYLIILEDPAVSTVRHSLPRGLEQVFLFIFAFIIQAIHCN